MEKAETTLLHTSCKNTRSEKIRLNCNILDTWIVMEKVEIYQKAEDSCQLQAKALS